MDRRSFLTFLGIAPIAAPVAVKALTETPVCEPFSQYGVATNLLDKQRAINAARSAMLKIAQYSNSAKLVAYRQEITREYVRENLFSPYIRYNGVPIRKVEHI